MYLPRGQFSAGGGFPHDWLPRAINGKEMFALLEVLEQCCRVHPGELRRAQVLMGRSINSITHKMLKRLFELQAEQGFWLALPQVGAVSGEPGRRWTLRGHSCTRFSALDQKSSAGYL